MKNGVVMAAALAAMVAGCQSTAQNQPVYGWMRADLRRVVGNPELEAQRELDLEICKGETQKSAVGMAPIYYQGLGGAINAAVIQNQRGEALKDVAKGCMAQRGYLLVTKEDGEARLQAAEADRNSKKKPSKRG